MAYLVLHATNAVYNLKPVLEVPYAVLAWSAPPRRPLFCRFARTFVLHAC